MASRKKRKMVDVPTFPVGDVSPPKAGGWTPWLSSSQTDHVDAPTIKLDLATVSDASDGFSSFAQLGSVLGKLESFNKENKITVSSTVSSIPSSTAIVPVGIEEGASLRGLVGVAKSVVIESTGCEVLRDRHSKIFEKLKTFSVNKCMGTHIISFATLFLESSREGPVWGILEVPGPFGTTGYMVAQSSPELSVYVSDIALKNDKQISEELDEFGITYERRIVGSGEKPSSSGNSSEDDENPTRCVLKITNNFFGFFDFLRQSEIIISNWKPVTLSASFPFKDSTCIEPKVSRVNKSANDARFNVVSVDNFSVPLSLLEDITDEIMGVVKMHVTSVGRFQDQSGPFKIVKQLN
jgi:hypothetical protein